MGIYGGLVGPKSENVEEALVLLLLFEGSRGARRRQPNEQHAEKYRLPRSTVWEGVGRG